MSILNLYYKKILAAIAVACIIAVVSGLISGLFINPEKLEEDAYPIAINEGGANAPVVVATADPIADLLATADAAKGQKLTKACAACHDFGKGGPNKIGPNLYGVFGRDKGSHAGFSYSEGMLAKEGNWDVESLNTFLWKPKKYVDGTKMNFVGLRKAQDRADVVKYLQTLD